MTIMDIVDANRASLGFQKELDGNRCNNMYTLSDDLPCLCSHDRKYATITSFADLALPPLTGNPVDYAVLFTRMTNYILITVQTSSRYDHQK